MQHSPKCSTPKSTLAQGSKYQIGLFGQTLAETFLKQKGLTLVHRNFRTRLGEIDLIMKDASTLVFIEVKTRRHCGKGSPLASVHAGKQQQILTMAQIYLTTQRPQFQNIRFDVVGVLLGTPAILQWVKRAFAFTS